MPGPGPILKWRLSHNTCINEWYQDFPTRPQAEQKRDELVESGRCESCAIATPDNGHYTIRQVAA